MLNIYVFNELSKFIEKKKKKKKKIAFFWKKKKKKKKFIDYCGVCFVSSLNGSNLSI